MSALWGTLVNFVAILLGSGLGIVFKRGIPERLRSALVNGMGLCVLFVGVRGLFEGETTLLIVLSIAIGGLLGTLLKLDSLLDRMGGALERRVQKGAADGSFAQGFVSASLLFCVGAMAIVGSLNSGLRGDHEMLFTKSVLDGVMALSLASTLGAGVAFSAVPVLLYQGTIALSAGAIAPLLSSAAIADMTAAGSFLIVAIALNQLKCTDIKVVNYIPAVFLPLVYHLLLPLFGMG